jgi:hypothetical protein
LTDGCPWNWAATRAEPSAWTEATTAGATEAATLTVWTCGITGALLHS